MVKLAIIFFAVLILFIGAYLVNHQHNLFGLTGNRARSISVTYGWTFVVLGILIAIGVFINVLVSVLFIVIATIATTMVAMAISRQLFK